MPEEEIKNYYLDNVNRKPENENQVDKFSQTTKLLDKELSDKKENILKVLEEGNLRDVFENLLSSEDGELCIMSLLECGNNEEEIKNIILANLPEGYAYNLSTNDVIKPEIKEVEDYTGAMITDKKGEEAVQDEEEAVQDEEEAVQDEEGAVESQDRQKEYEIMREAIGKRTELIKKYRTQNLDGKTNEDSDNYKTIKEQLENNGVLNQLRQTNHDDNFINDYILVQTTLQELKLNPTIYEQDDISYFDKVIKNLNNACNIPDTNLNSFSSENISQTRKELFNEDIGNDDLIEAKKSNLESRKYPEGLFDMENDEIIAKYGKFLEGGLKDFWLQYQTNPDMRNKINNIQNDPNSTDEDKQILNNYNQMRSAIENVKENLDTRTKDLMEELCIISQIKGMYMCMGEGDDFDLNKAKEIKSENGILTLRGHIDGVDFAIRQDTNNPEARLQTSQKLAKSVDGNVFSIGGKDNFVDSNFILPSQNEIFESITETIKSDNSLENSDNSSDYLENLQTNIMGKMEEKYKNTEYVHHYMQGEVGGEKVINETLKLITKKSPSIINDETLMKNISQETNKDLFDFIKILKFNIDNSSNTEKDKLNQCITKILEITNNYANNSGIEPSGSFKYPPIIENYLKDQAWLNGGNESSRLSSLSELFKYYSENSKDTRSNAEGNNGTPSKMIINDLYRDLFESSSSESLISQSRTTTQEHDMASSELDLALENENDFPPSPEKPSEV